MGRSCRGEAEFRLFDSGRHEDLGHMPVIENRVGREIPGHFAKTGLEAGLPPRAADTGLGVAHIPRSPVDDSGFDQRADREVGSRGIAAGVRNQPRAGNAFAAILRQSIDGLGEQGGLGVFGLVPGLLAFGPVPRRNAPAEIDDADSGRRAARAKAPWKLRVAWREIRRQVWRRGRRRECRKTVGLWTGGDGGDRLRVRRDVPVRLGRVGMLFEMTTSSAPL